MGNQPSKDESDRRETTPPIPGSIRGYSPPPSSPPTIDNPKGPARRAARKVSEKLGARNLSGRFQQAQQRARARLPSAFRREETPVDDILPDHAPPAAHPPAPAAIKDILPDDAPLAPSTPPAPSSATATGKNFLSDHAPPPTATAMTDLVGFAPISSGASTPMGPPSPASVAATNDWNPLARYPSSTPPRSFTPLSMWNKGPGVTERDPFGRHGPFPASLLWQYDGDYEDDLWDAMCKFRNRKIENQALDDRASVDTQELLAQVYAEEPAPKRRDSLPVPYATQQADKQRRRPVFPRTESAPTIVMTAVFSEK